MSYRCGNCDRTFETPSVIHTSYEEYYGVGALFGNHHSVDIYVCPYCHDEGIEEIYEDDEEDEDEK